MARYLALDTCTEICSVGLWDAGDMRVRRSLQPRQHTQQLLPMLDELMAEAGFSMEQLDGLFCTRGPGSFTGVRIGISAAQGLAYASGVPVWPLSTLAVLALQGQRGRPDITHWSVAMDARMGEAYAAAYAVPPDGVPVVLQAEALVPLADLDTPVWGDHSGHIGSAWGLLNGVEGRPPGNAAPDDAALAHLPQPESVLVLGCRTVESGLAPVLPDGLQPVYLRNQVTS